MEKSDTHSNTKRNRMKNAGTDLETHRNKEKEKRRNKTTTKQEEGWTFARRSFSLWPTTTRSRGLSLSPAASLSRRCACWIQGIGCVASTISKLVAVRMIPWANLSYTAQTLIISYGCLKKVVVKEKWVHLLTSNIMQQQEDVTTSLKNLGVEGEHEPHLDIKALESFTGFIITPHAFYMMIFVLIFLFFLMSKLSTTKSILEKVSFPFGD
ncbi:hypothetical protein P8452_36204 [Trifolium repens]|nr:hypothetical protein P8452_36204 [Trifolium repens]